MQTKKQFRVYRHFCFFLKRHSSPLRERSGRSDWKPWPLGQDYTGCASSLSLFALTLFARVSGSLPQSPLYTHSLTHSLAGTTGLYTHGTTEVGWLQVMIVLQCSVKSRVIIAGLSLSLSLCLSISVSVSLYVSVCVCLSVSVCLSVCLSECLCL